MIHEKEGSNKSSEHKDRSTYLSVGSFQYAIFIFYVLLELITCVILPIERVGKNQGEDFLRISF